MRVLNIVEVNFDVDGVKWVGHRISAVFLVGYAEAADESDEGSPRLLGWAIAVRIHRIAVAEIRAGGGVNFSLP